MEKLEYAKSLTFFVKEMAGESRLVGSIELAKLRSEALATEGGIARLLLHPSVECSLHAMVICEVKLDKKRRVKAHKTKHKVYQVIDGEMTVDIYSSTGEIIDSVDLNENSIMLFLKPDTYHLNYPKSDVVLFVEYIDGPFQQDESDRKYLGD